MASIFSKIISGEIPCYKIAEDDTCLAFLDVSPLTKGHTLVIPKKEVDLLFDLPSADYHAVHAMAKNVAIAIKKVVSCKRIGSAVIGLEVPHAHVHLVPISDIGDLDFTKERVVQSTEEFKNLAKEIRKQL
ncbi:MAG: histidine triad (HIT) family protein [Saprospiraceae bacterium]|jgi:histidine triad (HIT) family protein